MERVIHHAAIRMVHFAHEANRVGRGVEEIALEAIQIFDAQGHAGGLGVLGVLSHAVDAPLPFVGRGPDAREFADRRMVGAAEQLRADRVRALQHLLHIVDGQGADLGVGADRIVVGVAARDRGPLEADFVEPLAPLGEFLRVGVKDRQLHAVVAQRFELLEHGQQRIAQVARPQEHVHAEFHGFRLRS